MKYLVLILLVPFIIHSDDDKYYKHTLDLAMKGDASAQSDLGVYFLLKHANRVDNGEVIKNLSKDNLRKFF